MIITATLGIAGAITAEAPALACELVGDPLREAYDPRLRNER